LNKNFYAKKKVCLVRPKDDSREFLTRSGLILNEGIEELRMGNIFDLLNYQVIGFDEAWMLNPDLIESLIHLLPVSKIETLIFSSLMTLTDLSIPPSVQTILKYADTIVKLNAICYNCGSELGNFNWKEGKKEKIEVGDSEYKVFCFDCWNKMKKPLSYYVQVP
jgi:thymidine kinase